MMKREDLSPLFTDVAMSSDDAVAIVAALKDIADCDGTHEDELQMIQGFVEMLSADLGETDPRALGEMSPAKLALKLDDPTLRTIAVQSAVLLAWADGKVSAGERARIKEYADALGIQGEPFERIERLIAQWVKEGDFETVLS